MPSKKKNPKRYWLMKSEPDVYSIDQLKQDGVTLWEGVRNYQARNFMMKDMKEGDPILFYHSNAKPPGVVGIAKVHGPAVPDPTQFAKGHDYHDKKATPDKPIWYCVPVRYVQTLKRLVSLSELRQLPELSEMVLLRKGSRLSIQPLTEFEFSRISELGNS
jgi:predicted RNA-binding protein with PUA-like domain